MKVHIIGCSGSGKSDLARRLAAKYALTHVDLDEFFWDNTALGYGVKREPDARDALLQQILQQKDWIIEGVYYAWCQPSFAAADRIYVLDLPAFVCKWRVIRRFALRKLGLERGKRESFRSLWALLRWMDTFRKRSLPQIRQLLSGYGEKVIVLHSGHAVRELLQDGS